MEAITREEKLLSGQQLEPITRKELFLAKAAGMDVQTPEPITREEIFLSQISGGGGSAPAVIEPLSVTANGTYNPPEGVDGYSPVTVSVARDDQTDMVDQWEKAISGSNALPSLKQLPSRLTKIRDYAFYYCTNLYAVSLPPNITSIGKSAFYGCSNLALTTLPSGVTDVLGSTFSGCTKLALTSLPDGVKTIESSAFKSCSKLAIKSIPAGVTSIGLSAFESCSGLTEITFEGKPTSIKSAFGSCTNLLTINVPWAEGEVANAPWGATNATINYNYTGG